MTWNIPFWAGNEDLEDEMDEQGFIAVEPVTDPFLQALNEQDLPPASYALELLKQHTLNRQQILAVAPIVCSMEQMFQTRSDPASHLTDGTPTDRCRTLWLGAGGSGKTYAYNTVLRPLFRRFFGEDGYVVGAPTHAAVRLLGPEARTLHKWANVGPSSGLDRRNLRSAKSKGDLLEKKIKAAQAVLLDEMSMHPPDVYHAAGYRFSLLRQEQLKLDLSRYLEEWFGNVPVGIQLADFLQLRPTAQKSLCEWRSSKRAIDPVDEDASDEEGEEDSHVSNNSELGRLLFKNSLLRVVHFTGTGRFSDCSSGRQLVEILTHMRNGTSMSDSLWAALEARSYNPKGLANAELQTALLRAHWGGFAWEQVARLQHIRVGLEARQAKKTVYLVQAIDRATGSMELTKEQSLTALQFVNMTKSSYLMGLCPLYEGMLARISCILPMPMLTRELPVIVRAIKLHPQEPPISCNSGCIVLKYQPVAVLVEIDDPEYKTLQLPNCLAPPGHVYLQAMCSEKAWTLPSGPKQHIPVIRKQFPLAPRNVLTHYGLQGITARHGLVAFLSKPGWMKDPDYALALYVMLSRARKLEDLWLVDLPPRPMFESFLQDQNPLLVERMAEFQQVAMRSEESAVRFLKHLEWHVDDFVSKHLSAMERERLSAS